MSAPPPRKLRPQFPEGPYLVVGLARSGQAVARLLVDRGNAVKGVDSGHPDGAAGLGGVGVEVGLDADGLALLDGVRTVVKSPGVPRGAPVISAALERGIDVVGELELAWRAIPSRFLAVTGTNGKTTAVEWLGHVYRTAGEPVAVAGHVGTPLSELVGEVDADATVVCEASSFQLADSVAFAPECAVFLNLAPDHLDRHLDLESYLAAKLRIFASQGNDDVAVYNADDPALAKVDLGGCARRIAFCHGADAEATVVASESLTSEKGEPYAPLLDSVRERCRACYLTGASAGRLAEALAPAIAAGIDLRLCEDLEEAVRLAAAAARPGETVLLSPACASFDAFENFERRGERFRELVEGLA